MLECIWSGKNRLGEGPLWDAESGSLYWVDILAHQIHRLHLESRKHSQWQFDEFVTSINKNAQGLFIVTLTNTIVFFDPLTGGVTPWIGPIDMGDNVRFNDAKLDPQGRLWAGTMDLGESEPVGGLYRITPEGEVTLMQDKITIGNGMAWTRDQKTFYYTDSQARKIFAYDFEPVAGTISNRRVFATLTDPAGYPDGLTIDQEDYIWGAHWAGWRLTRYAPDGSIDRVVEMPVERITSCCFGGPDLKTLFITTADGGGELAGNVFSLRP
jgi:sugar lactone lactonase YvrE